MIYQKRDNKRQKKRLAMIIGVVAAVFCLAAILNFFKPNFFSPAAHFVFRPVLEARGGFLGKVRGILEFAQSKSSLIDENQDLKDKLALLEAAEQERDYYKDANSELLKLADKLSDLPKAIFSRVLSKPGFSPYDTIIIDAGDNLGIKKGDKVLADHDNVLGVVGEVYAKTSVVNLYSSPKSETQVLVGKHSVQTVAFGKGGGNFEIKLPRNTEINVGDSVSLTSSLPAFLGIIEYIEVNPTDSFERAIFKSSTDINKLSFIVVLKQ